MHCTVRPSSSGETTGLAEPLLSAWLLKILQPHSPLTDLYCSFIAVPALCPSPCRRAGREHSCPPAPGKQLHIIRLKLPACRDKQLLTSTHCPSNRQHGQAGLCWSIGICSAENYPNLRGIANKMSVDADTLQGCACSWASQSVYVAPHSDHAHKHYMLIMYAASIVV